MSFSTVQAHAIQPPAGDLSGEGLERYARNPKVTEAEKIEEASRQFEAVLLRQVIAAARKTVIRSNLESEKAETGIYQDMINAQLAESISRSGSLGLARSLQVQVSHPKPQQPEADDAPVEPEPLTSLSARNLKPFRARHD